MSLTAKEKVQSLLAAANTATGKSAADLTEAVGDLIDGQGGNPNPVADENDVIFIDYDGTIRYSYTLEEIQALTELPPAPNHTSEGLIFDGWNWTLAELKELGEECVVGALYKTSDGYARMTIAIPNNHDRHIALRLYASAITSSGTISWGDGETENVTKGDNTYIHVYADSGRYVITIQRMIDHVNYITENSQYLECYSGGDNSSILCGGSSTYIKTLTMSQLSKSTDYPLQGNYRLMAAVLNSRFSIGGTNVFRDRNIALRYLSFPPNGNFGSTGYIYNSVTSLRRLDTVNSLKIGSNCFTTCSNLTMLTIGKSLQTIGNTSLTSLSSCQVIRFRGTTPPVFSGASVMTGLNVNYVSLLIPYTSTEYLAATNYPNPATYSYFGYKNTSESETLPASQGNYSLTWYGTLYDAKTESNPITTGNGAECYARYTEVTV